MEETERDLEDEALANGAYRFRRRLEELAKDGDASAEGAARKLLLRVLEPTIEGITNAVMSPDQRPWMVVTKWATLVGIEATAYITIKVLLGRPQVAANLSKLAPTIARLLHDELRYQTLRKEARGLFEYRMSRLTSRSYKHKAYALNQTARYAGVEDEVMSEREAMKLGMKLINICVANTGIGAFSTVYTQKKGKNKSNKLFLITDEIKEMLEKTNDILQLSKPQALPMVIAPLPWSAELNGGYHYALRGKYGLVRRSKGARARDADMPFVYAGLNAIQNTAWRINSRVLQVVVDLRSTGTSLGGLPNPEPDSLPERAAWMLQGVPKSEHTDEQTAELRDWKRRASEVKKRNNLRASKLIEWLTAISLAVQFEKYDHIWFPHNLDFRGRTYPICSGLQPQGSDLQRGLLVFGDGKPLGTDGAFWLAVHGANTLGEADGIKFSKQAFEQRVQWVRANSEGIQAIAADPRQNHWWSHADKPFQFLAFCIEWSAYLDAEADGKGESFSSALPIGQDGTCNGLQHFAALLRDPVGAREVNLSSEPVPRDVYDAIHTEVRTLLATEAVAGVAEAEWWLQSGHLSRQLFKRPTMTFAYGSNKWGMTAQLEAELLNEKDPDLSLYCRYLSTLIWQALAKVIHAAFGALEWLAACAGEIVPATGTVSWVVPLTNFPVMQAYWDQKRSRVKTTLCGEAIRLSIYEDTKKALKTKHKNSISPNFIHSLDAAALMMTVVMASAEGVESFGMVHDCYATHACDVPALAAATREAFITLYDGRDVADDLYQQFSLVTEVPAPPAKGTFDVHEVRDSRYFFS